LAVYDGWKMGASLYADTKGLRMRRVPEAAAKQRRESVDSKPEKRLKPGAGLGLAILIAIVFWSVVLYLVFG
jgi:hypothetical protein